METALRKSDSSPFLNARQISINNGLMLIGMLLVGAEPMFNFMRIANVNQILDLSVKIIFFNHVHTYFTLAMFFLLPEFRDWFSAKAQEGSAIWVRMAVVPIIFFGIWHFMNSSYPSDPTTLKAVIALMSWIGTQHLIAQTYGICRMWDSECLGEPGLQPRKQKIISLQGPERKLYLGLLLNHALGMLVPIYTGSIAYNWYFLGIGSALAAGVYLLTLNAYGSVLHPRTVYSARYLLYPLFIVSPMSIYVAMAVHGIEYLFLFHNAQRNSRAQVRLGTISGVYLVIGALTLVASVKWDYVQRFLFSAPFRREHSGVLDLIAATSFTLVYFHYYLDHLLFSFRDRTSRKFIFPLFTQRQFGNPS